MPPIEPASVDPEFDTLRAQMQQRLVDALGSVGQPVPLYTTNATDLFAAYLDGLPEDQRQLHNCRTCRRFLERYGGLVTISEAGTTKALFWASMGALPLYGDAAQKLGRAVERAQVMGVFYTAERTWGTPTNTAPSGAIWTHLSATPPASHIHTSRIERADQAMAAKRQDFETLSRALGEFSFQHLDLAVTITSEDNDLYRSEKVRDVAVFLRDLKAQIDRARGERKRNILWRAVATAPTGWCHPRSSMIGTLLEDIAAGLNYAAISARFAEKMRPSNYQRATVAPAAGTIKQAEQLFEQLGLAPALARRYAQLGDLPKTAFVWRPTAARADQATESSDGVFARVRAKQNAPAPAQPVRGAITLTWEKFQRTVLPHAVVIEALIPSSADRFVALTTAADADAPPILQWDSAAARNPFAWYYAAGIDAEMRRRVVAAGGRVENIDIRCSLLWNNYNDLDLHCFTPYGAHIYYGDKRACRYGGWLDVDMNVHGDTDKPVENIRWEKGRAPSGLYQFFVNLYRTHRRGGMATPFTVEIEIEGQVFTTTGVTRHENPSNGMGAMVRVAAFMYERGKAVEMSDSPEVQKATTPANAWNVTPGAYAPVTAIVRSPNLWSDPPLAQHGQHAFFLVEGCRDTQEGVGRGFFVETLLSDLRPVRSVIEAYNATAPIAGADAASACGIGISNTSTGGLTLRVNGSALYTLDRWD